MQWRFRTCLVLILTVCGWAGDPPSQGTAEPNTAHQLKEMSEALTVLRKEIATLRKTVARLEIDLRRENARRLQAEITAIQTEQFRLAELDRARLQDLDDLDKLLGDNTAESSQRADLEAVRGELAAVKERELVDLKEAARERQSDVSRRLQREEHLIERLEQASKQSEESIK